MPTRSRIRHWKIGFSSAQIEQLLSVKLRGALRFLTELTAGGDADTPSAQESDPDPGEDENLGDGHATTPKEGDDAILAVLSLHGISTTI